MKMKLLYLLFLSFLIVFYSCSKKDNSPTSPQPTGEIASFYPGGTGSVFSYSSSINNVPAGNRIVTIGGNVTIKGNAYNLQKNFVQFGTDTATTITYFRKSTDTLFFYVDTTGLTAFIPATLRSALVIKAPNDAKVLGVPLNSGNSWTAYKLNVAYPPLLSLDVIQLTAFYKGSESLSLNLTSGQQTKTAQKIQYQLKLSIPDPQNFTNIKYSFYNANAWFVEGLGVVKLEGNAAALEAITRNSITLGDSTKTASETLTSYTIK